MEVILIVYLAIAALVFTILAAMVLDRGLQYEDGRKAGAIMSTFFLIFAAVMSLVWPAFIYLALRESRKAN